MVESHAKAVQFGEDVVAFVGSRSIVSGNVKGVSAREPPGCADCQGWARRWNRPPPRGCGTLIFSYVRERMANEEDEGTREGEEAKGEHKASIHYTLPFEPEPMRKKIIMQLAPSAARYL